MAKYDGKNQMDVGAGGGGMGGGAGNISSGRMGTARTQAQKLNDEYKAWLNEARGRNPKPSQLATPLNKEQMRARDKANAEVQKKLPRLPRNSRNQNSEDMPEELAFKKGGKVKCMAKGGGCEVRGKTKGRFV